MKTIISKTEKRDRRRKRIRAKLFGTASTPRLSVFKSNQHISAQLIDDEKSVTLAAAHSRDIKKGTLLEKSSVLGEAIARFAIEKKITQAVFDRGGFMYTGCVKALAEGARKGGLKF
jgi:large subunit ribosomal protein L18